MNNKGITLISVVITTIILIILAGITVAILQDGGILINSKNAKFINNISQFYEEYNIYILGEHLKNKAEYDKTILNADGREIESDGVIPIKNVIPSIKEKYFLDRIKINKGVMEFSNFTKEEQGIIDKIITEQADNDNPTNPGEGEIYDSGKANKPIPPTAGNKLGSNDGEVVAITYDETGSPSIVKDLSSQWYSYEEQKEETYTEGHSRWANMQTSDGSLWVWIPRFAYKITDGSHIKAWVNGIYGDYNGLSEEGTGKIEIKFLKGESNEFYNGTGEAISDQNSITYTGTSQNEWLVHPAFKFGNKQLEGFWVAKYEASSVEGNSNNMKLDNVLNTKTIQIKPNKQSWRYIDTANIFGNCIFMGAEKYDIYGFEKGTNTHMMKNIEWGAVAYLAHSSYGRNGTNISKNESTTYITGTGGKLASTTGNYYGIFDMVGGASDAVAATTRKSYEEVDYIGEEYNVENYFDIYEAYDPPIYKGDAIYETSLKSSVTTSWFKGLSWMIGDQFGGEALMSRGGYNGKYSGENASIFGFYRYKWVEYQLKYVSFRPTIIADV